MPTTVSAERLADLLGEVGQRPTAQRLLILGALMTARRSMTAQDLYDTLHPHHPYLGRATIFRTLDSFVDVGLARRFEREGHLYAYVACEPTDHHHVVCQRCGITADISCREVRPFVRKLEEHSGFSLDHGALDFYGMCASCQHSQNAR